MTILFKNQIGHGQSVADLDELEIALKVFERMQRSMAKTKIPLPLDNYPWPGSRVNL